jgi:hypothetical protein
MGYKTNNVIKWGVDGDIIPLNITNGINSGLMVVK